MMRRMLASDLAPPLVETLEVTPLLDRREELKLASQAEAGDSGARQRLVQANLRLVVQVARTYNHRGVDLTDVVQDGTVGLIEAVDRFDPSRGFRLSTLAKICIRDSIIAGLARGHLIRLPPRHSRQLGLVQRAADELRQRCGRQPTADDLAAETGIPAREIVELQTHARRPTSLETDSGSSLSDAAAADAVVVVLRRLAVRSAVAALPPRERFIVERRFGLVGEPMTLANIGRQIGLTHERVRQIQKAALERLRTMLVDVD
jgi:RNA polymerase sigma factor (sigma-70 family)